MEGVRRRGEMLTETRDLTPGSDINFNSPSHRSSQDGSFIQDDADMHLILDFGSPPGSKGGGAVAGFRPTSVLTSSWITRQQTQWATDFDANIAELDFDNVNTEDILALGRSPLADSRDVWCGEVRDWNQNTQSATIPPPTTQHSLDLSLSPSQSLFSSHSPEDQLDVESEATAALAAATFISTDSLDASSLAVDLENLKAACATRKRDYFLTFDPGKLAESGLVTSVATDYYQDAKLSNAFDQANCTAAAAMDSQELLSSKHLTTWGRIRRSYEVNEPSAASGHPKSSSSLPNLSHSPLPTFGLGAGEKMSSGIKIQLYNLNESSMTSSQFHSCGEYRDGISLLRVFQNKLSSLSGNLREPHSESQEDFLDSSSGYVTGETIGAPGQERISSFSAPQEAAQPAEQGAPEEAIQHDNQEPGFEPTLAPVQDYGYAEYYVDGRYIDVNHNEIGFTPPSTLGVQHAASTSTQELPDIPRNQRAQFQLNNSTEPNRWAALTSPRLTKIAPIKPPRTFAALMERRDEEQQSSSGESGATPRRERTRSVSVSRMRDSGTQVPVYVVDQSVQTSGWSAPKPLTTTSTWAPDSGFAPGRSSDGSQKSGDVPGLFTGYPRFADGKSRDLPAEESQNPDLSFMRLPFSVPPFLANVTPFPLAFLMESQLDFGANLPIESEAGTSNQEHTPRSQLHQAAPPRRTLSEGRASTLKIPPLFPPDLFSTNIGMGLPNAPPMFSRPPSAKVSRERDSGLGTSGPSHIQDWDSLATLLPKDVVQTCSYFKVHPQMLNQSQINCYTSPRSDDDPSASIDKPKRISRMLRPRKLHLHKGRRPISEPNFDRGGRVPGTIFESIHEEEGEAECRGHRAASCGCELRRTAGRFCDCKPYSSCPTVEHSHAACSGAHHCFPILCHPPPQHSHHHFCCERRYSECCDPQSLRKWHRYQASSSYQDMMYSESEDSESDWDERRGLSSEDEFDPPSFCRSEYRRGPHTTSTRRVASLGNMKEHINSSFLLPNQPNHHRVAHPKVNMAKRSRSEVKPCATCYRVRSPTLERPPLWAVRPTEKEFFCDCQTSDVLEELEQAERRRRRSRRVVSFLNGLRSDHLTDEELAVRNTQLYHEKRALVDQVCAVCDKLISTFSQSFPSTRNQVENNDSGVSDLVKNSLCPALEKVLADGLRPESSVWNVIRASAPLGPATKSIHELVSDLSAEEGQLQGEHSLQLLAFVIGLLNMHSLDCWMSYLVLKDRVMAENYEDSAFLRQATSAYRSLFTRVMMGFQALSLLPFNGSGGILQRNEGTAFALTVSAGDNQKSRRRKSPSRSASLPSVQNTRIAFQRELKLKFQTPEQEAEEMRTSYLMLPTRLPSDSRVPKSSSIPSRLSESSDNTLKSHSVDSGLMRFSKTVKAASPSRIPVLTHPPPSSLPVTPVNAERKNFARTILSQRKFVCAIDDIVGSPSMNLLECRKGETLEVLAMPTGRYLRCRKGKAEGLVERELVTFLTFL